jgi:hypothetical protein
MFVYSVNYFHMGFFIVFKPAPLPDEVFLEFELPDWLHEGRDTLHFSITRLFVTNARKIKNPKKQEIN